MIVLIDTCVILDALQKREPFWEDAAKIFLAAANEKYQGIITAKALTDIYYLTHRYTHEQKKTRDILLQLLELFFVEDTLAEDCKRAFFSETSDYEDAVMIETAKRIKADVIVTRNLRDYKETAIPVMEPERFLRELCGQ